MSRLRLVALLSFLLAASLSCGTSDERVSRSSGAAASVPSGGPVHGGRIIIGTQQEPEMLSEILNSMATNNLV